MSGTVEQIMRTIEAFAPPNLAENWDNIGLQVGAPGDGVDTVLVALSVTPAVLDEAVERGADLIVTHHPVIFNPLHHLRTDQPAGALVARLIQAGIAVYTAHTNLDAAAGGLNDWLASRVGLQEVDVLTPSPGETSYKLVAFVPAGYEDAVRDGLADAGAGWIGNYSHCTFQSPGQGTFLPQDEADPFLGERGRLARVDELRLEVIVPAAAKERAIEALLAAHPYDEVAYDLYPLVSGANGAGLGRLGTVEAVGTLAGLGERVKERLGLEHVRLVGDPSRSVQRVAVFAGSGADAIPAALAGRADVLVTGDIKYQHALDALASNLALVDAGHFGTEALVREELADRLQADLEQQGIRVRVEASQAEQDPFAVM